jgi:predicted ABC-type ATPase
MFAGPNGSGKSTIKRNISIKFKKAGLGVSVDPDEIEARTRKSKFLDFRRFGLRLNEARVRAFLDSSSLLRRARMIKASRNLEIKGNRIYFTKVRINSYFAAALADFIREELAKTGESFSFETVMSFPGKVEFLKRTQQSGYRNYLYFVATRNWKINEARVKNRVKEGGHDVPSDKIRNRYYKSLELLRSALPYCYRAFIFDNSDDKLVLLAEAFEGKLTLKVDSVPAWFAKYVLSKTR